MQIVSTCRKPFFLFSLLIFIACKKESTSALLPDQSASNQSSLNVQTLSLVLQPGPKDGDDAYVMNYYKDSNYQNSNWGQVTQLNMEAWTIHSRPVFEKSYIKFDSLSKIPSSAKITSAHLYLYGIMDSSTTPQGNSIYPGSPYDNPYPDNSCIINRLRRDWNENTITWNNAPDRYSNVSDTIPASTSKWNYNVVIDVRNLVRHMVADSANYGFSIKLLNQTRYRSMVFASSENPHASKRPKLVVNYQLP